MELDVLIVGAGPVGLTLACELKRYGLEVRIVDSANEISDKSKALVMWPRTLEHLARLQLDQKFIAQGLQAVKAQFFQGDKPLAEARLDTVDTPYPYALMIPQSTTERLLTAKLAELGGTVEHSVTCTGLSQSETGATATLTKSDGTTETVTARWIVGCDGPHSAVRHALGSSFEGDQLRSNWVLGDVKLEGPVENDAVQLHLHPEGLVGLFPIPPDRFRVIASYTHGVEDKREDPTLAEIQGLLDERVGKGLRAHDASWLSSFHINERKVADFRQGNVFLAGDSAHIHSPAGGQGMNTGMQDAFNLAWKLALISKGRVTKAAEAVLLTSYNAERGPVAKQVLSGAGLVTRGATLDNALLASVRNAALRLAFGLETARQVFAEAASELAVSYQDSPLNGRDDKVGPRVGERAPIRPDEPPVSVGDTPRFALYAKADPNSDQLIDCYPQWLEPKPREPFAEDGVWLVRPDGYVAFAGDARSWAQADAYFARMMYEQS